MREYGSCQIEIPLPRFNKTLNISLHETLKNTADKWMDRQTHRYGWSLRYTTTYTYKETMPRICVTFLR
jgi:hypothetical protein